MARRHLGRVRAKERRRHSNADARRDREGERDMVALEAPGPGRGARRVDAAVCLVPADARERPLGVVACVVRGRLGGTAAVIDEPVGTGRVVSFSTDPNFRAWTVGMQKMLRNAVLGGVSFSAGAAPRADTSAARRGR